MNHENKENNVIPFTKESVRDYLDICICFWRKEKDKGCKYAMYYIDAFQSVRTSIFGELLREEK